MEIERKWLVNRENIPYDLNSIDKREIEQIYVSFSPVIRVRKINDGEKYILTVKTKSDSKIARNEFETELSAEEYNSLAAMGQGNTIRKTRYLNRRADGLLEEIDIFKDVFEDLCYMEIEFPDVASCESFPDPDWVIADVTGSKGFTNGELAEFGMPDIENL